MQRIDRPANPDGLASSACSGDEQARWVCLNTLYEDVVRGRRRLCIVVVDRVRVEWRLGRDIGHVRGTGVGNDHTGGGSVIIGAHGSSIRFSESAAGGTVEARVRPALRARRRRTGLSRAIGLLGDGAVAHQRNGNQFRSADFRGRYHGRRFRQSQEPVRCVGDLERDRVRVHRGCAEYDLLYEGQ